MGMQSSPGVPCVPGWWCGLVQWGKTAGPYSRLSGSGTGEGIGRGGRVEGHLRKTEVVGEELATELVLGEGEDDEFVQLADGSVDQSVEVEAVGADADGGGWTCWSQI